MIEPTQIGYAVVTGVAVLTLVIGRSKAQYKKGALMAFAWVGIAAIVLAAIIYWPEVKNTRFYASIVAGSAIKHNDGSLEFARADDGHFHIDAKVNNVNVRFLLDTGAADIVLTKDDARRSGYYTQDLQFNKLYSTANGMTRSASVKLKNLSIGSYQTGEIYASVNEGELDSSLLGMSFLNRMKSYHIEQDKLTITP